MQVLHLTGKAVKVSHYIVDPIIADIAAVALTVINRHPNRLGVKKNKKGENTAWTGNILYILIIKKASVWPSRNRNF